MSTSNSETPIPFTCSVCCKSLTDRSAFITSCGHFFCLSPPANCTQLKQHSSAGICEQCGNQCSAIVVISRAAQLDPRVKSYVFGDPVQDLKSIMETIKFRENQRQILSENAQKYYNMAQEMSSQIRRLQQELANTRSNTTTQLTAQVASNSMTNNINQSEMMKLQKENDNLRHEYEQLKRENATLRSPNTGASCASMTTMLPTRLPPPPPQPSNSRPSSGVNTYPLTRGVSKVNRYHHHRTLQYPDQQQQQQQQQYPQHSSTQFRSRKERRGHRDYGARSVSLGRMQWSRKSGR